MALTTAHIALIDILSDRVITAMSTMKQVPGMTDEEVAAETAKWEELSDSEMDKLDGH